MRAQIGEGGMASVYIGRDRGAGNRLVALKVIKEEYSLNREFVNMFLDEGKIVSTLKHPNLIEVLELGSEGARLFIAMELLQGYSLWHVWTALRDRHLRLRYDMTAWIGARIAEGLHHAHEARDPRGKPLGVVHRDVNASNIFLTYDGQVKVIDFGLAKGANRVSKTAAGVVKGKFAYMSPEQALGKPIDRRTDIFALAATLWELTVDKRLFKGKDDFETLRRVHQAHVRDPRALVEGYPDELAVILKRALDRDRTKRPSTAREFAQALDRFSHSEGRNLGEPDIAAVMGMLFEPVRPREREWLAEASAADRPPPPDPLRLSASRVELDLEDALISEEKAPPPLPSASMRDAKKGGSLNRAAPSALVSNANAPFDTRLFAPAAIRPPVNPNEPELPSIDLEPEDDRARRMTRTALIGAGIVLLLALAMLLGAFWGQHPG